MAHTKSAKKRILQNERDRLRNMAVKSRMKTYIKKAMDAIEAKDEEAIKTIVPQTLSEIDRAASKGVIHANSAARKKSMLQRGVTAQ
jgi:small subunit ribosomal protein S20